MRRHLVNHPVPAHRDRLQPALVQMPQECDRGGFPSPPFGKFDVPTGAQSRKDCALGQIFIVDLAARIVACLACDPRERSIGEVLLRRFGRRVRLNFFSCPGRIDRAAESIERCHKRNGTPRR